MDRFFLALIALLLPASICMASVLHPKLVRDNTVYCARAVTPPVIDGRLDDACWSAATDAPQIGGFVMLDGTKEAKNPTQVYLAYDDKGLYVAFRCMESDMSRLKTDESSLPWRDDSVEVFIDADRDRGRYCHFVVDAAGAKFQQTAERNGENMDPSWRGPWDVAVRKGRNEWTVEMFIPASTLGLKPRQGTAIRANFGRNEISLPERTSWNATPDGFHQPLNFGNVILGKGPSAIEGDLLLPSAMIPGRLTLATSLKNGTSQTVVLTPTIAVKPARDLKSSSGRPMRMDPGGEGVEEITLGSAGEWQYSLDLLVREKESTSPVFVASYRLIVPPAPPSPIGAVLAKADWGTVWEACATSKVMPHALPPAESEKAVRVYAARNEYEPFQIVLTPEQGLKNVRASVGGLKGPGTIPAKNTSIKLVETVSVTTPTSPDCAPGDYPDPLPPFTTTDIAPRTSTALWLTVYVPADAVPGDYNGTLFIRADGIQVVKIPVSLHVWNFALPKVSHLRTAYGHNPGLLCDWDGVTKPEDQLKVADLLNEDFIAHRIAPYSPMAFAGPKIELSGGVAWVDWTEFDRSAAKYLPRMNGFNLPCSWIGDFLGAKAGTLEYRKLKGQFLKNMAAHLREKGWMEKGYIYIWDEPTPEQYQMVVDEAKMWHEADPGYRVLLTEQPEKELAPEVNIYVPVLPNYNEKTCPKRRKQGDQVWWYVCCGPHHPFPNNFIDYPAIDHRILHWMNWKYGVTGVLYWSTMYWQDNPWATPMSYTPDRKGTWGNGDGHLLYPPRKGKSVEAVIEGPVDSIRWEMIREGVEDYDYLYMLNEAVKKAEARGRTGRAVEAGKKALALADSLVRGLTDYEKDPRQLYAVRRQVAEALEKLQ